MLRNRAHIQGSTLSDNSGDHAQPVTDGQPGDASSNGKESWGNGQASTRGAEHNIAMGPALSLPRALLRRLAMRATHNPIEVIVSIFIIVTLAYFQLVHALATSNFLEPLTREATGLAAASSWTSSFGRSHDSAQSGALWVKRAGSKAWVPAHGVAKDQTGNLVDASSAEGAKRYIVEPFLVADAHKHTSPDLSDVAKHLQSSLVSQADGEFVGIFPVRDADLSGYGFGKVEPASGSSWKERRRLLGIAGDEATLNGSLSTSSEDAQYLLAIFPDNDDFSHDSGELRSVRWAAYAMWALGLRFWALFKRADSADIFVMLSAYILMHGTFVNLFLSMRRFGSNFWLGASVLTSSICAFMCAMTMAYLLGVTVDPICLSEALPFLVITVGFEKPFLLTKAVFTNSRIAPQAATPTKAHPSLLLSALNDSQQAVERQRQQDAAASDEQFDPAMPLSRSDHLSQEESFVRALTARLKSEPSLRWSAPQPVPAKEIVVAAVDAVGVPIVRDYAIEIAVMGVGATSGVSGLREFCQLAALILIFDCAFLFAFMVATLTIMVEVHRIKVMRGMKRVTPSTPPNVDSDVPPSALDTPHTADDASATDSIQTSSCEASREKSSHYPTSRRPLWRKALKLVFGKVPFEPTRPGARENPVARLKLLLVTTFLTLHSLNLVSTLTTQSALTRHHSTDGLTFYQTIQQSNPTLQANVTSRLVAPLLERIATSEPTNLDLYVTVHDPVVFMLMHPDAQSGASTTLGDMAMNASGSHLTQQDSSLASRLARSAGSAASKRGKGTTSTSSPSLDVLDSFMSGWSVIVGDPVISKWLSLALVISIFLNAYLLKGIATGNAAVAEGNAAGAAAFAAARMIGAHLDREAITASRRPSGKGKQAPADNEKERLSQYHRGVVQAVRSQSASVPERTSATKEEARDDAHVPVGVAPASEGATPSKAFDDKDNATPQGGATLSINGVSSDHSAQPRPIDEILEVYADGIGAMMLSDEEVILLVQKGKVQGYALEKTLQDNERAVRIRRATISRASASKSLESSLVPLSGYDYSQVIGACCENVVGFMPLPLGIAGPLMIDGQMLPIPMATTEGTLVASTSRGCKALNAAGGVTTVLTQDAMTRGPAVEFTSISQAAKAKRWIDSPDGASTIKEAFDSTSRFARLSSLRCVMAGRTLYVRFATSTGDAMGMNMVSKGVEKALDCMSQRFDMQVLSLSGNYCIDKKPSAINWIEGRGKSVCCEAVIPAKTVKGVLKATVADLVNLNVKKNLIGSAMAGSIGGFNAHAANIVAAVFLATGQDPAQVVESSMCMTLMEAVPSASGGDDDLLVTVSMPAIEVGTVGGGTILSPQRAMLEMLGVAGSAKDIPGSNAQRLARIIAAAVMAGELSLMGALSAGHLIQAHMKHNRSVPPTPGNVTPTSSASMNGGILSMATAGTPSRGGDGMAARFQASMTPLVAPPVGGTNGSASSAGPASRGSPTRPSAASSSSSSILSTRDRRSASAT